MFCKECGKENLDTDYVCIGCKSLLNDDPESNIQTIDSIENHSKKNFNNTGFSQKYVDDYMIWAILVTIFCGFFPGIVAIIYSAQVRNSMSAGDVESAKNYSKKAKFWCIIGAILAATIFIISLIMGILFASTLVMTAIMGLI